MGLLDNLDDWYLVDPPDEHGRDPDELDDLDLVDPLEELHLRPHLEILLVGFGTRPIAEISPPHQNQIAQIVRIFWNAQIARIPRNAQIGQIPRNAQIARLPRMARKTSCLCRCSSMHPQANGSHVGRILTVRTAHSCMVHVQAEWILKMSQQMMAKHGVRNNDACQNNQHPLATEITIPCTLHAPMVLCKAMSKQCGIKPLLR